MIGDKEFQSNLRKIFAEEAEMHLQTMSDGLLALEKSADANKEIETLETVCLAAHSLKGAARAADIPDIEAICQAVESIFLEWQSGDLSPDRAGVDLLFKVLDGIRQILSHPDRHLDLADTLTDQLKLLIEKGPAHQPQPEQEEKCETSPSEIRLGGPEESSEKESGSLSSKAPVQALHGIKSDLSGTQSKSVRIAASKLDDLLLKAEQMLTVKLRTEHYALELSELFDTHTDWKKEWSAVRDDFSRMISLSQTEGTTAGGLIDPGKPVADFLNWNESFMKNIETRLEMLAKTVGRDRQMLGGLIDDLLTDTKQLLLLPFATLLQAFPRMVRDISRELNKDVELHIQGDVVEVDKRILDALKDPMIHLVRNCIDHGIESPEHRKQAGKPACGRVGVAISQQGSGQVEIVVSDDGQGIDLAKVKETVVRKGLVSEDDFDGLNETERFHFVFRSGVSTSPLITEVSGRGLGLAIVQEQVEKIGGSVSMETAAGKGTTFRFLLPLTLATFRAVTVESGGRMFALPTASIERVARIASSDVKTMENRESIVLDTVPLALVRLDDLLGLPRTAGEEQRRKGAKQKKTIQGNRPETGFLTVIILKAVGKKIAFVIDGVHTEQEILVKSLGPQLVRVKNIGGATVLSSGQVVPILNVYDLLESASKTGKTGSTSIASVQETPKTPSVLIAEDSITSRTLLRSILESAGYLVTTAVDGKDALTALKTGDFDAMVSDVEMPRMDGFELTRCIRAEKRFADLPVVLVTALESQHDREQGVEAGANAYILKSSFDQSNLVDVLEKLI